LKYSIKVLFVAAIMSFLLAPSIAQTPSNQTGSSDVGQQFKSGANRVGEGAAQIGEGIKQGAIMTWDAIKAAAAAAAAKFEGSGSQSSSGSTKGSASPTQQSQ